MVNTNKAIEYIRAYYDYKIDLETLHNELYKLFGSYKEAVNFLYNITGGANA